MMATTLPVAAPAPAADGGIVLGTALAGLAMAIVCVCIGWQAPEDGWGTPRHVSGA